MNSKQISEIASLPLIQKFVFAIIQNIRVHNLNYNEKGVIYSDLVPKVSEKVMQASLKEKISRPQDRMASLVAPLPLQKPLPQRTVQKISRPLVPSMQRPVVIPPPMQNIPTTAYQSYGKIAPLLNDPSVSSIECSGVDAPLTITRMGQVQNTRIVLSKKEIDEVLQKISEKTHIPILEGVFRAAVDGFNISAVISEIIGSKFIIRKVNSPLMVGRQA
jgi:hypothetical protein